VIHAANGVHRRGFGVAAGSTAAGMPREFGSIAITEDIARAPQEGILDRQALAAFFGKRLRSASDPL
jgi:hypothetical protein